ncbi:MAG: hypothetical protein GX538_05925 [Gammaproteobacteria bacterium]|nr:hypothetical protein [Gammaproteobacteria bacterium]
MNTLLRCCVAAATVAGLAACAHSGTMGYQSAAVEPSSEFQHDGEYIQAVEYTARHRGVEVHWVNPPLKRLVATADDID